MLSLEPAGNLLVGHSEGLGDVIQSVPRERTVVNSLRQRNQAQGAVYDLRRDCRGLRIVVTVILVHLERWSF
jgi:hypothetical protein